MFKIFFIPNILPNLVILILKKFKFMKKILLTAVLVGSLVACDKKADTTDSPAPETPTTETPAAETPAETPANSSTVKLSNPEAQKVADEYGAFIKEYMEVYKSGDATKIADLTKKSQEWATKLGTSMATMSPEDAKLLGEYMQQVAQEMATAATPTK